MKSADIRKAMYKSVELEVPANANILAKIESKGYYIFTLTSKLDNIVVEIRDGSITKYASKRSIEGNYIELSDSIIETDSENNTQIEYKLFNVSGITFDNNLDVNIDVKMYSEIKYGYIAEFFPSGTMTPKEKYNITEGTWIKGNFYGAGLSITDGLDKDSNGLTTIAGDNEILRLTSGYDIEVNPGDDSNIYLNGRTSIGTSTNGASLRVYGDLSVLPSNIEENSNPPVFSAKRIYTSTIGNYEDLDDYYGAERSKIEFDSEKLSLSALSLSQERKSIELNAGGIKIDAGGDSINLNGNIFLNGFNSKDNKQTSISNTQIDTPNESLTQYSNDWLSPNISDVKRVLIALFIYKEDASPIVIFGKRISSFSGVDTSSVSYDSFFKEETDKSKILVINNKNEDISSHISRFGSVSSILGITSNDDLSNIMGTSETTNITIESLCAVLDSDIIHKNDIFLAYPYNIGAIGNGSFASGKYAASIGAGSISMGYRAQALGENSISIGSRFNSSNFALSGATVNSIKGPEPYSSINYSIILSDEFNGKYSSTFSSVVLLRINGLYFIGDYSSYSKRINIYKTNVKINTTTFDSINVNPDYKSISDIKGKDVYIAQSLGAIGNNTINIGSSTVLTENSISIGDSNSIIPSLSGSIFGQCFESFSGTSNTSNTPDASIAPNIAMGYNLHISNFNKKDGRAGGMSQSQIVIGTLNEYSNYPIVLAAGYYNDSTKAYIRKNIFEGSSSRTKINTPLELSNGLSVSDGLAEYTANVLFSDDLNLTSALSKANEAIKNITADGYDIVKLEIKTSFGGSNKYSIKESYPVYIGIKYPLAVPHISNLVQGNSSSSYTLNITCINPSMDTVKIPLAAVASGSNDTTIISMNLTKPSRTGIIKPFFANKLDSLKCDPLYGEPNINSYIIIKLIITGYKLTN